jgi:hypothetical protein
LGDIFVITFAGVVAYFEFEGGARNTILKSYNITLVRFKEIP